MFTKWFYGNEISEYGQENGRVDYRTFAKAFDAVLNNEIMGATDGICGYWEQESGFVDNTDKIEEIQEEIDDIESKLEEMEGEGKEGTEDYKDLENKKEDLERDIEELEEEQDDQSEVFQWYIIDDNGARICKEFNEIVYYNETLDMYLWGVTHYGTSWDHVLTDIPCYPEEAQK